MLAWGINDFGQLGNGSTFYETEPTKVHSLLLPSVAALSAALQARPLCLPGRVRACQDC